MKKTKPTKKLRGWSKCDYHIHSSVGDAVASPEEIVDYAELQTDLSVIAISDHDQIKGGIAAQKYAKKKKYKINVIVGEEVSTMLGHCVGLFMKKRIRRYTKLVDTVKAIHGQGGIVIAPHPLSWLTTSLGERAMRNIVEHNDKDVYFDAVELMGATVAGAVTEKKARVLNSSFWNLPAVGGSDSHSLAGIGTCYTLFKGKSASDLKKAIIKGNVKYGGRHWTFKEHWELFVEKFKRFKVF